MNRADYRTIKKLNSDTRAWREYIIARLDQLPTPPADFENFVNVAYLNQYIENIDKPWNEQAQLDRTYCHMIAREEYNKRAK